MSNHSILRSYVLNNSGCYPTALSSVITDVSQNVVNLVLSIDTFFKIHVAGLQSVSGAHSVTFDEIQAVLGSPHSDEYTRHDDSVISISDFQYLDEVTLAAFKTIDDACGLNTVVSQYDLFKSFMRVLMTTIKVDGADVVQQLLVTVSREFNPLEVSLLHQMFHSVQIGLPLPSRHELQSFIANLNSL